MTLVMTVAAVSIFKGLSYDTEELIAEDWHGGVLVDEPEDGEVGIVGRKEPDVRLLERRGVLWGNPKEQGRKVCV
jgi:hypothetical protein